LQAGPVLSELRARPEVDYYKVLQVDPTAEPEVIEASYRALSKKYHPDRNSAPGSAAKMSQINTAFDVLRDSLKRRDYDSLRSASSRISSPPPPTNRPASYAPPVTSQPRPGNNGSNGVNSRASVSNTNRAASPNGTSNGHSSNGKASPRPNHNVYPGSKGTSWGRSLLIVLVIVIAVLGGFLLAQTFLDTPLSISRTNPAVTQSVQTVVAEALATPTRLPVATVAALSPPAGPLTREQVFSYLNNSELYEGRVSEVVLVGDTVQLKLRLRRSGRIVNGIDNPPISSATDELDLLRQSELTAYTLTYSLFGRYSDLKLINLSLSDPADDKKVVYRAQLPRVQAYSFGTWRGTMDSKTLGQQDFVKAAREDRILLHLGGPMDDATRSRLNQPSKSNLVAELASWDLNSTTLDILLNTNGATVGYFAVRPEEEKLTDYARIFYALYTRFPNLDRIQVQDTPPGTNGKFSRASTRAFFNRITPLEWAQLTFDGRVKELLDRLPSALNTPSLNPSQGSGTDIQVNSGSNVPIRTWQVVNPGTSLRLTQISSLNSAKGQFVLVKVPLKNLNKDLQWPFPNGLFSLADAQGGTYQPDLVATLSYTLDVERKAPFGPIEQNRDLEMRLVFDIPLTSSGLRLLFQDRDGRAILPITPQN